MLCVKKNNRYDTRKEEHHGTPFLSRCPRRVISATAVRRITPEVLLG
jgi:hypothetical protein